MRFPPSRCVSNRFAARPALVALLAIAIAGAGGSPAAAQITSDDLFGEGSDEAIGADDLFGPDPDDLFGDDEEKGKKGGSGERDADELFAEKAEKPVERTLRQKLFHFGVEVPADVAVVRPIALVDTGVGLLFFTFVATPQVAGQIVGKWIEHRFVPAVRGVVRRDFTNAFAEELYVDQANVDQAWQQLVSDPFAYAIDRPLGDFEN